MVQPFNPDAVQRAFALQGASPQVGETTRGLPEGIDMEALARLNRSATRESAEAFGVSLLEGLTWQGGDRFVDRIMSKETGPIERATRMMMPGMSPLIDVLTGRTQETGPVEQFVENQQAGHPVANVAGEMVGGAVTGGALAKLNKEALKRIGERGAPWLQRQIRKWVDKPTGRIAGSTAEGLVEGAASAANEGESIRTGALSGAGGGAGGQLALGELIPGGANWVDQSGAPQNAARYALKNARQAQGVAEGTGRDLDYGKIEQNLAELGPGASLMDANRGFTRVGEALVSTSPQDAQNILYRFDVEGERIGHLPDQFQGEAIAALPLVVNTKTQSGNVVAPRTAGELGEQARLNRQMLQKDWDAVLDNSPVEWGFDDIMSDMNKIVRFEESTSGKRAALTDIQKTMEENSVGRVIDKHGNVVNPGRLSPRAVLTMRKELDKQANAALNSGDRELAASLLNARSELNDRLIDEVGGFATINAQYSNEFSYERLYEATRKAIFNNNMNDADITIAQQHASPADLPAALEGAMEGIVQKLETANNTTVAKNFLTNPRTQSKLKAIFGDDAGQIVIDAAKRYMEFKKTSNKITGKSPTAPREALRKELQQFVNRGILLAGLSRIAGGGRGTTLAPSSASTYSALGRDVSKTAATSQTPMYTLLDEWLSQPGAKAKENLDLMRRLDAEWYPSSSLLGRGTAPQHQSLFDTLTRSDVGNAPAQGAAVASAGAAERNEQQKQQESLIEEYLKRIESGQ